MQNEALQLIKIDFVGPTLSVGPYRFRSSKSISKQEYANETAYRNQCRETGLAPLDLPGVVHRIQEKPDNSGKCRRFAIRSRENTDNQQEPSLTSQRKNDKNRDKYYIREIRCHPVWRGERQHKAIREQQQTCASKFRIRLRVHS